MSVVFTVGVTFLTMATVALHKETHKRRATNKSTAPSVKLMYQLSKATTLEAKWKLFQREYMRFHKIARTLLEQGTYFDPSGKYKFTPATLIYMNKFGTIYSHFFGRLQYEMDCMEAPAGRMILVDNAQREAQALLNKPSSNTLI